MFRPFSALAGIILPLCLLAAALAGSAPARHISSRGISLSYSASLAREVTVTSLGLRMSAAGQTIPGRAVVFGGYTVAGNPYFPPTIWVLPANLARYRKIAGVEGRGGMASQIHQLRALLKRHPDLSKVHSIPYVLPVSDESELLASKKRYLPFADGTGVSFVTAMGPAAVPITNATPVRWEFRGITRNGRYVVTAEFPLKVPGLPNKEPKLGLRQQAALIHGWKKYLEKMRVSLDRRANSSYGLALGTLDAVARTIRISK